jgi:hypothetical protein
MSSEGSSPHHLERRKKSRCDVDTGEGGPRSHPPRRQSKRIVHRNFSRGDMHIDTEIVEENPMDTSDDESTEDESIGCLRCHPLKMAPRMRLKAMTMG